MVPIVWRREASATGNPVSSFVCFHLFGLTALRARLGLAEPLPPTLPARLTEDVTVMGTITRLDLAALTLQCLDVTDCMNKTYHAVDDSH